MEFNVNQRGLVGLGGGKGVEGNVLYRPRGRNKGMDIHKGNPDTAICAYHLCRLKTVLLCIHCPAAQGQRERGCDCTMWEGNHSSFKHLEHE